MRHDQKQDLKDLSQLTEAVMEQLTKLSASARNSKEKMLTKPASDLYYAANRAWHELDTQSRAIAKLLDDANVE